MGDRTSVTITVLKNDYERLLAQETAEPKPTSAMPLALTPLMTTAITS